MEYAFNQYDKEKMVRAAMRDVAISFKTSIMLAQKLRGMMSDKALTYLAAVMEKKLAVPFTRFRDGAGHKPGMGSGKYPIKAAQSFSELIALGVANAENSGLGTPLKIVHILANEGSRPMHPGRNRGRSMKRTHLELVLAETEESKKREKKAKPTKKSKKSESKEEDAAEAPKEVKKEEAPAKSAEKAVKAEAKSVPVATEVKKEAPKEKPAEKKESPKESPKKEEPKAKPKETPKEEVKDGN